MLALFILTSAPAMAEEAIENVGRVLPPLPLAANTATEQVQSNPFCEPASEAPSTDIQLASGNKSSSIRLVPIGAAVGLQSIDHGPPEKLKVPAITIENIGTSVVRNNPLIASTHHDNQDLIDTEVIDQSTRADAPAARATGGAAGSSIVLNSPPAVHALPSWRQPEEPQRDASQPLLPVPLLQAEATAPVASSHEPVFFSMSDRVQLTESDVSRPSAAPQRRIEPIMAVDPVPPAPLLLETAELTAPTLESRDQPDSVSRDDQDSVRSGDADSSADGGDGDAPVDPPSSTSIALDVAQPIMFDDPDAPFGLEPIEPVISEQSGLPIAIAPGATAEPKRDALPEATLHAKRYRPPVAINTVPIAIERETPSSGSSLSAAVQAAESPNLDQPRVPTAGGKLTPLYLNLAQVRSLTLGGAVRGVQIADKGVCEAIAAGPNQLKLIGTGSGVTQLVVWADSDDAAAPARMRTFEIHVKEAVDAVGEEVDSKAALLDESIRKAFPNSQVRIEAQRGQLIVTGRCDSENTAAEIIRMIRKTCLIPVQDRLVVR
jgi:hypothetical protein